MKEKIPKVFSEPKLQKSYEAARRAGLIGKITFA